MNLAFTITTHAGDWSLAIRLLSQLLEHHKRSERVVIVDGPLPQSKIRALEGMATKVVQGEALKTLPGSAWLERWVQGVLEHTTAEIIIKLDPDSYLTRAIHSYPEAEVFGQVVRPHEVLGAARGTRRSLLKRIWSSGLLLEDWSHLTYSRKSHGAGPPQVLSCEDHILAATLERLNVTPEHWGDICVRYRPAFKAQDISSRYAIWHPIQ